MELHIEFSGENAAQVQNPLGETVRVLKHITSLIENGEGGGLIHDLNGNRAGQWYFTITGEDE